MIMTDLCEVIDMQPETIRRRFSVMNNAYRAYSFAYFLDSMDRLGLRRIDLWGGVQHFDPFWAADDASYLSGFRSMIRDRDMELVAYTPEILAYPYNFAHPDEALRKRSVRYAVMNLEIAARLEIPIMLVSPGSGLYDVPYEESFRYSVASLTEIAAAAEKYDIILALEHLTPASSNLLTDAQKVMRLIDAVSHPRLQITLDLGQMSVFHETVSDYFTPAPDKIANIHIMDGDPSCHLAFGDGILPLRDYLTQIDSFGYRGPLTLEINDARYLRTPHEALEQCVRELRGF